MQKIQISMILCIGSVCLARDTYENSSPERSDRTRNDMESTGNMWKNALLRNWIILNTHSNNHNNINNSRTFNKNDFPRSQLHFQKEGSHPNYFEYEHNAGDGSYGTNVKIIEPYIVTISEMRARGASVSDSSASFTNKITMPQDIVNSLLSLPQRKETYNRNAFKNNESEVTATTSASEKKKTKQNNNNGTESFYDGMEAFRTQLDEMISPLQSTLNKFMHWCYMAECLTDNDDEYDDNDDNNGNDDNEKTNSTNDNDLRFKDGRKKITAIINAISSPGEVQGREGVSLKAMESSLMVVSSESTARSQRGERAGKTLTSASGTGRRTKKLKRKLSKLIFPLLIAYKLKFLTLIPVLIGGLILLVGTTGLAGFFFALFTAVMSLKATAGKSIVIKKI